MRLIVFIIFSLICVKSFTQKNFDLLNYLDFEPILNDIWGYTDTFGNEYALVGLTTGVSIVKINNPDTTLLIHHVAGDSSLWRDIKVYNNYGYAVNEDGGGLLIMNFAQLPNILTYQYVTQIGSYHFETAHNIFIDENGIAYLLGSNIANQGAFMINLNTTNRFLPEFVGLYDDQYVHDAYARGDTLYTAELNNGTFSIIDVSNKSNPIVLARKTTGTNYTHNIWLSDDGKYVITTDEKSGAYVELYDISNLNNIKLVDKYRSSPSYGVIPHNAHFKGNYIFTSYYRDGLRLVDATLKHNLVEVGYYDSSPFNAAEGFEGNWGVYPYFNSGKIIISDREEGLFVLQPHYTRASYLTGNVFDTLNNIPLNNASVEIIGTSYIKETLYNGTYNIGTADSGYYDIRVSKPGCSTVIKSNVLLETAIEKVENFETKCINTGVNDIENLNFKTYFSSNGKLLATYNGNEEIKNVVVVNALGQTLKKVIVQSNNFSIEIDNNYKQGIYFILFETNTNIYTSKSLKS